MPDDAVRMTEIELLDEVRGFVQTFYEAGNSGKEDFPHTSRRGSADNSSSGDLSIPREAPNPQEDCLTGFQS